MITFSLKPRSLSTLPKVRRLGEHAGGILK